MIHHDSVKRESLHHLMYLSCILVFVREHVRVLVKSVSDVISQYVYVNDLSIFTEQERFVSQDGSYDWVRLC